MRKKRFQEETVPGLFALSDAVRHAIRETPPNAPIQ